MSWFSAPSNVFDVFACQWVGWLTETNETQEKYDNGFNNATEQPIKPGWSCFDCLHVNIIFKSQSILIMTNVLIILVDSSW